MKSPKKSKTAPENQRTPTPLTRQLTRQEIDALRKDSQDGMKKMREMEKSMRNDSSLPNIKREDRK
jgi:5-bromo-4-chloroindolyl phosphate hydrolysis protein